MDTLNNQVINLDNNLLVKYFNEYVQLGFDINDTRSSIIFKYDPISKEYIEHLVNELYRFSGVSFIFKPSTEEVGISSSINKEDLYYIVSNKMADKRYNRQKSEMMPEVESLFSLFNSLIIHKSDLSFGVQNNKDGKNFKFQTPNSTEFELIRSAGLTVQPSISNNKTYYVSKFSNKNFSNVNDIILTLKRYFDIYSKQYSIGGGFSNNLFMIFFLAIDILSITVGIYLLTH